MTETRKHLPGLLQSVERGNVVEVTRRGKSVAVLMPMQEYQRMHSTERSFWVALEQFRQDPDMAALKIGEGWLRGARSRDSGRRSPW